ncbi:RcnB family protein [Sphingomonas sp. SRS2]|uniref:RcnB family protein n=1 Tax=Sphingomonas sp. SRS2 TaxID=133190 RepID=UPI0006184DB4|nr:RcnB family protein [Sphingomonas sp. SRS2]KKC26702.1 membrane protein [Sphingomonas sp. SRS2]
MRTPIILGLMAAVAVPSIAPAQSLREARESQRDVREERRDLREAQAYGDRRDVREARRDLRDARQEARSDWRDYRRSNRDVYRRPAYVGPRGYAYRPVGVGYRFQPHYYSSRYVISDPYRYRLPRTTGYNRWVRYGNDVVLVNIRTGRVIEVHNSFFW